MKITVQATKIVTKLQTQLTETFGVQPTEATVTTLAKEVGLAQSAKGRFGCTMATEAGLKFAGLSGEIAENPGKTAALVTKAAKAKEEADAAFVVAEAAMQKYKAAEAELSAIV